MHGNSIAGDGDGYTRFPIVLLNAHNLSPALEANGMVRMEVLEYQGKLDRISGRKRPLRHDEHPAVTDVTGDARLVFQFHEQLDPKALRPTPV